MAWQDLHGDLEELFGEFTTHAEGMLAALERRRQWANEYMRTYWRDNPGKYAEHKRKNAVRMRERRQNDPVWAESERVKARARKLRATACRRSARSGSRPEGSR